ncbi:MAG: hypothetical protein KDA86_26170 [Planctomycetaceae bacterium]|nr:hypothetical protein [Planctomycetaceae bacterium]
MWQIAFEKNGRIINSSVNESVEFTLVLHEELDPSILATKILWLKEVMTSVSLVKVLVVGGDVGTERRPIGVAMVEELEGKGNIRGNVSAFIDT